MRQPGAAGDGGHRGAQAQGAIQAGDDHPRQAQAADDFGNIFGIAGGGHHPDAFHAVRFAYGITASDVATGLMQSLKDIAGFDAGGTGNFSGSPNLSQAQNTFLSAQITSIGTMSAGLNTATAHNGNVYNQLQNATTQQTSMSTLYKGFVSNIQDTDMATAATQLSLNQTALQAALQVTSTLNHLTLLNYLGPVSAGG